MVNHIRVFKRSHRRYVKTAEKVNAPQNVECGRSNCSDTHTGFQRINDHRTGGVKHSLADTLMAGFAMFSLKDPSLMAFDERRHDNSENLRNIYSE